MAAAGGSVDDRDLVRLALISVRPNVVTDIVILGFPSAFRPASVFALAWAISCGFDRQPSAFGLEPRPGPEHSALALPSIS